MTRAMANGDPPSAVRRNDGDEEEYVLPPSDGDCYPVTKTTKAPLPNVRDKGYAWVVIAVMFLSNVITAGYIKSFGITYNAIAQAYPDTSTAAGGVLMALLAGCRSVLAPLVGAAVVHFGYRPVMMFGVMLCSTGLFSSYFCNSVPALAVTLGAMMGVGMCAIETGQVVVLSDYFQEKKELANSIRVAGNPLGGAALPFFLVLVFEYYGLRLTYIILSALFLQLSVLIFLLRPYKTHQKIVNVRRINAQDARGGAAAEGRFLELPQTSNDPNEKSKPLNIKLFTNPLYLTFVAMMVGFAVALPQTVYFIPIYGNSIGLSPEQNSAILAYQSFYDSFMRLLLGYLLDRKLFKKNHCFVTCLAVGGIGTTLFPFARGFWGVTACITFSSLGLSGYYATINVMLLDLFGRKNVSSSWGFIRMLQGILNFAFPPLLGLLVDVSGSYHLTFLTMGAGMLFAGFCVAMQPLVARVAGVKVEFK